MLRKMLFQILVILSINTISSNLVAGDFIEMSFADFIRFISSETEQNYIIDSSINDRISVFLPSDYEVQDTQKILNFILVNNELSLKKVNSINYISKLNKSSLFVYDTKYLHPNNAIELLERNFKDINFNYVNKRIIFETTSDNYNKINAFLSLIDVPLLSRNLKINLIYFNNDNLREFGVNLEVSKSGNNNLGFKSFINQLVTMQQISSFSDTHNINLYFTDLQKNNVINFKFSPIVTIYNGNETDFDIVKNIPFIKTNSQSSATVNSVNTAYDYRDIGTKIKITDVSITDKEIYFKIELTYEILLDSSLTPKTSKRFISNYLKLNKGESILISGLSSDETSNNSLKVPFLSNIPYLGKVFEYEYSSTTNETFAVYIEDVEASLNASLGGPRFAGE